MSTSVQKCIRGTCHGSKGPLRPYPTPRVVRHRQHSSSTQPVLAMQAQSDSCLLIGATGITGRSAVYGLMRAYASSSGKRPRMLAMTRSPTNEAAKALQAIGVDKLVLGDLDNVPSLAQALQGHSSVYCHALSKDAVQADPAELVRAHNLATAAKQAGVRHIVYHSSGGKGSGYGITQMEQKHKVEGILLASGVPCTALEATLFMEELWKKYTRPGILKGKFTFSVPSDVPIQLLAAQDLGLVLSYVLAAPDKYAGKCIELAGDALTPVQMCAAFSKAQGNTVTFNKAPAWPFWFLARDVYRISRFLSEKGFGADVVAVRQAFAGMLTFAEFLEATSWADESRTYEQGVQYKEPSMAQT